jgi:molecular chaperone HtpG
MTAQKLTFQAEVSRLLHLMVHSVYSQKEIFLRELISNASDACDRLRYAALTQPELMAGDDACKVVVRLNKAARQITVWDNGIGMNRDELVSHLGTIARSGTRAFVEQMTGDQGKDVSLIGQFGVGFYSVFMVADSVTVTSRKAGEEHAWSWRSEGTGEFTIDEASDVEAAAHNRQGRGTTITLHLKSDADEFLEAERLRNIVKTYADHIALPIFLDDGKGEVQANGASALWARLKSDVSKEQYTEFYHHVGHAWDEPWTTIHYKAEGTQEYNVLLFIPSTRPYDLFDPSRKHRVKLYVKRVFITDECEELLPGWMRFLRGVVDSADLPLNISREMLQHNPVLARMRQAIVKRVLTELEKKAEGDAADYAKFWESFGAVLKEGLYEDGDRRDQLLKLARFRSTKSGEGWVSLADYVARMKPGQTAIHYLIGDTLDAVKRSPHLEGYAARDIEVLLLTDPVDDFWLQAVHEFDKKPLNSVTKGGADLDKIEPEKKPEATEGDGARDAEIATLIALLKQTYGDRVADVKTSARLTDSPVCLVAEANGMDLHLERMLRAHNRVGMASKRVLEINPRHATIVALAKSAGQPGAADRLTDSAELLLDQARIVEGEPLPDPAAFARRLSAVMAKGVAG